jgi:hypothetical protein
MTWRVEKRLVLTLHHFHRGLELFQVFIIIKLFVSLHNFSQNTLYIIAYLFRAGYCVL